ncbi:small ribosomal subunit protein bS1-like [Calliopsis andreniformis]|uniref:small ribosomal subunit protein bS1-like n=1 Tax=Calliopsis andreniformis TaxID=337506 RepID=UPI003FCC2C9A
MQSQNIQLIVCIRVIPGIKGLVHSSEITWIKSNSSVSNVVTRGQEVYVKILSIDTAKIFINTYPPGSIVSGEMKNNTGSYVSVAFNDSEIDENVKRTIYVKDLSWSRNSSDEIKKYKVGDKIEAKVIRANVNRARIYLGIKQTEYDSLEELIMKVKVEDKIQVIVGKRGDNGLVVEVDNDVTLPIDQEHLPENKKFSISEKIEVEVLDVEEYNIVLSAKR